MAESFGVKMGVEGEKEFKNALKEINSAFMTAWPVAKAAAKKPQSSAPPKKRSSCWA